MVDDFIARKQGKTDVKYELPQLEPILADTYGVIAYQEQVMRIAQALAGFTLGQADVLRKAMGKKDPKVMAKQREAFMAGARKQGVNEKKATKIFDLMEGSAQEAHAAIQSLTTLLRGETKQDLKTFVEARRKEKRLAQELSETLCRTFVTPLEREDIEAISNALYRIPKTAEKLGKRFILSGRQLGGVDFSRHVELLDRAAVILVSMVRELRKGVQLKGVKAQNDELQLIEGEGDKLMLESLEQLYESRLEPFQAMLMKDLLEMLEKIFDRCRDVGNNIFHIILKHA